MGCYYSWMVLLCVLVCIICLECVFGNSYCALMRPFVSGMGQNHGLDCSEVNMSSRTYRRVNITILEDQYRVLSERGLNVSGLIRDLLGDHLSEHSITLQVGENTRAVYDAVVSNTGASDEELEVYFRQSLAELLERKIEEMKTLRERLV